MLIDAPSYEPLEKEGDKKEKHEQRELTAENLEEVMRELNQGL